MELEKVTIGLDIYNACRTNTGRACEVSGHYNMPSLLRISGANFDELIGDLNWCAEHRDDEEAINTIKRFAEALLSAYEIQRKTYQ